MATSSQKFIARNRAPRVQIEYDVELYGAEKKVQLPFVMGVLSDLSGKPSEPLPPLRRPPHGPPARSARARMRIVPSSGSANGSSATSRAILRRSSSAARSG